MVVGFNKKVWTFVFSIMTLGLCGQSDLDKGNEAFRLLKYQDAIGYYEKVLQKNDNPETREKLAEAYFLTGDYPAAEKALLPLADNTAQGDILLRLANLLLLNNKKKAAGDILEKYIKNHPSTNTYKRLFESINMDVKSESSQTHKYDIIKAAFSSEVSDFSPIYYGDNIIFTSQRGGKKDPWTGRSFSNICMADPTSGDVQLLAGNLNGKFHNGAVTFMNSQTMIFTRNNRNKGKNDAYNLILAMAQKEGDKWNFVQELPFNDKEHSNAYPTYLPSKQILIFSSDQPGGFGGMDLYYTSYIDGQWSTPVNLGSNVNTGGDEVFPYTDGTDLYFASNGRPGIGGLDIYKVAVAADFSGVVTLLPVPVNSTRDDFGFITKDGEGSGYFSSNRTGNGSVDNIYNFIKEEIKLPQQDIVISGKVIDEYTKMPLKETEVLLTNLEDGTTSSFITEDNGRFSFTATTKSNYVISGSKNGISTTEAEVINTNVQENYYYTLLHNDPRFSLEGYAINNKTQNGVKGVTVMCYNKGNQEEKTMITDEEGFFKFQLEQNTDFEISGKKGGYYTSVSEASTKGLNRSTTLYVKLFLTVEEVIIGDTKILGKETFGGFDFDPVYYDLDKHNIRPDAALALDKVVDFLRKNPDLKVELGSHTDSRASDQYNKALSQKRAQAAVMYITSKGIDPSKITARGYGESNLVNRCQDGVPCSEDEHQRNRRTEIKIVGFNAP